MDSREEIWVVTTDSWDDRAPGDRLVTQTKLNAKRLSSNINMFLEQLNNILENAPEKIGNFQFEEFELHAEISTEGELKVLGTGVGIGGTGGLKFVFRRSSNN